MRLIFMGSPDFAVPSLRAVREAGHEVVAVVSQPARRSGRGKRVQPTPVAAAAEELGIPALAPEKADEPGFVAELGALKADAILVVAYGQILSKPVLDMCPHGCINAHASLLPRHRGATPLQAAIRAGDEISGVSLIRLVRKLDAGPILMQRELLLEPNETAGSLHDKLSSMSAEILVEYLDCLRRGNAPLPEKQEEDFVTYAGQLEKGAGWIDWRQSAEHIDRHVRGMSPWPGAYSYLGSGERRLKILAAENAGSGYAKLIEGSPVAGTVVTADVINGIVVATGSGYVRLKRLQLPGRKELSADKFAHGRGVAAGDRLW